MGLHYAVWKNDANRLDQLTLVIRKRYRERCIGPIGRE